ncbi:MAG TPA: AAA family ATPase, partial [Candidatus Polarisedimenticolia bacterium]|nr:AAA family ATPase [Candidatus Polarisedimenticolia bacterium]
TAAAARKRGRVFPFLGTKGGCGTTTLSTNLAVTLAGRSRAVLLIDLHPWAGDISMLLNLKPAFGVADVALNVHRLDRELLGGMLVRHESGLHVLPASESPDKATLVQPSHVTQILNFARGLFDYVVVSTGEITDPLTLAAVNQGDLVHLVSCLDLLSLRRAQWVLRKMAQFGLSPDLLRLVINRYEKNPHISLEEAERILGLRVAWKVPAHPGTFQDALNEGVALVSRCRDDLSRCFEDYAGRLGAGETTRTTAPLRRKILGVFSSRGVKPAAEGGAPV